MTEASSEGSTAIGPTIDASAAVAASVVLRHEHEAAGLGAAWCIGQVCPPSGEQAHDGAATALRIDAQNTSGVPARMIA